MGWWRWNDFRELKLQTHRAEEALTISTFYRTILFPFLSETTNRRRRSSWIGNLLLGFDPGLTRRRDGGERATSEADEEANYGRSQRLLHLPVGGGGGHRPLQDRRQGLPLQPCAGSSAVVPLPSPDDVADPLQGRRCGSAPNHNNGRSGFIPSAHRMSRHRRGGRRQISERLLWSVPSCRWVDSLSRLPSCYCFFFFK